MNPIAERIRQARTKAGMTEKELAKKCGLSAGYISQIETGKKIINETAAAAILKVFGDSMDTVFNAYIDTPEKPSPVVPSPAPAPRGAVQQNQPRIPTAVEPTDQWAGALASIIREFQITDLRNGKVMGSKELPVLSKKIEGIPWEKLRFFTVPDDEMSGMNLNKGDILWVHEMQELQGEGIYVMEVNNRRQIRQIFKRHGQWQLSRSITDPQMETVDPRTVRLLGRCVRLERNL